MAISSMAKNVPFFPLHTKVTDGLFPSPYLQKISYRVSDVKANFMCFYTRNAIYPQSFTINESGRGYM